MPDTYIKFIGVHGESADGEPATAPSVQIPITVKHHITPPEEADGLTAGDTAPEDGAQDAFFVRNDAETTTQSEAAAIDPYTNFNFTVEFDGGETGAQMNGVTAFVDASNVYGGDPAADDDHDIIFDPDGDLKPPSEPVGASTPSFDTIVFTVADDGLPSDGTSVPDSEGDTLEHEAGHFTQMAWDETRDSAGGSFGFTDRPDDAEAPVPPGEIIIMPEPDCPPDMTDDGGCGDPVPDAPAGEDTFDWSMELA